MKLRCDLHIHTERSFDSRTTIDQAILRAKSAGLDCIALTDHDCCQDPSLFPYQIREDILLLPGIEISTDKGHLLGLFLEKPLPPLERRTPFQEAANAIRQCGGMAILAHPFQSTAQTVEQRQAMLREMEPELDGLEIYNRRATKKRKNANELAGEAAKTLSPSCLQTAGSDSHLPEEIGSAFLLVECEEKTPEALRRGLLQGALQYSCAPCCHRAIAQSQKIKVKKTSGGLKERLRLAAFQLLCHWRDSREKRGYKS